MTADHDPHATETGYHFGRDPLKAMGKTKSAAAALVRHMAADSGEFDRLGPETDPNQIEALDIVRLTMLGKPVAPHSASWLLSDDGRWLTAEKLAKIPPDLQLGTPHPQATFWCSELLSLLDFGAVLGHAQATRLLAAKRPAIAPIDDRTIRRALKAPRDEHWWRRWRSALTPEVKAHIAVIRDRAAETEPAVRDLSTLRIIDITARANTK